jgi:hypothetical protein
MHMKVEQADRWLRWILSVPSILFIDVETGSKVESSTNQQNSKGDGGSVLTLEDQSGN